MPQTFGEKLQILRKKKDISGETLAKALGKSQGFVSHMETGKKMPGRELAQKIADYFDVSLESLIDDSKEITASEKNQQPTSNVRRIMDKGNFAPTPIIASFQPCAGNGNAYADYNLVLKDEIYPVPRNDLLGHAWQGGDFYIAEIDGESMEPKFSDGDNVLFVCGQDCVDGDVVVAIWRNRVYIRGYFVTSDRGIELRPYAQGYEIIRVPLGDERLLILGKVIRRYPKSKKVLGFYN